MSSNSVAISPQLRCETWFMEGRLVPNEHFLLINDDFSNLFDVMDNVLSSPQIAKEISQNAKEYIKQFLDKDKEELLSILVLAKYFYYSQQLEFDKQIIELFKS